jgi:hypothetical protein
MPIDMFDLQSGTTTKGDTVAKGCTSTSMDDVYLSRPQ